MNILHPVCSAICSMLPMIASSKLASRRESQSRDTRWLGFCETDLEAVIDLKQEEEISSVSFNTSVDKGDWVFDVLGITVSVSNDGKNFTEVFNESYPDLTAEDENKIYSHRVEFTPVKARFVKILALSDRDMPEWHGGKGYPAFIFVDELEIN